MVERNLSEEKNMSGETNKKVPVEVYSRVTGYFRPVKQWNPGKTAEFHDRTVRMPVDVLSQMGERFTV